MVLLINSTLSHLWLRTRQVVKEVNKPLNLFLMAPNYSPRLVVNDVTSPKVSLVPIVRVVLLPSWDCYVTDTRNSRIVIKTD